MKRRAVRERPYSAPGSWKAFFPFWNSDRCVCIPEPGLSIMGLGMNVATVPIERATSLTTVRNVRMLSAVVRASA